VRMRRYRRQARSCGAVSQRVDATDAILTYC
jgi:hypothetical protein